MKHLANSISGIKILSEEESAHPALLSEHDPKGILGKGIFGVIDPIDSTVNYAEDSANWCVGGGLIADGIPRVSAIYAPANNNGLFILAAKGYGVWCAEWDQEPRLIIVDLDISSKKSVVRVGVDTFLYRAVMSIMPEIACNVRAVYSTGSGILGLANVAIGKSQVVIQSPQKAWDWAAAYSAVVESGNVFQFFRIKDGGAIIPVETFDYEAFCFEPKGRLGFVAGVPLLVKKVWDLLPKNGWQRVNPDTVSATW